MIDPVLHLGVFTFRWYGLILATAILAAYFYARQNSWRFGISKEDVDDFSFWAVIVGILGARIYYVIFNLPYFSELPQEIYKIWHGGLSIYGALIAGLVFVYFYCKKKAYNFSQLFALMAISLPLGQAIGRLGNFINQEAFGLPTNLPWKIYIEPKYRPAQFANESFFHPTFLYEILLDLLIFFILFKLASKVRHELVGWSYLLLYSLGRFFIEAIRLDSFFLVGFRVDQVVAFLLVVVSGIMILRLQPKIS